MKKYKITKPSHPDKYIVRIERNKIEGEYSPFDSLDVAAVVDKQHSSSVPGRYEMLTNTATKTLEAYLYEQALKDILEKVKNGGTERTAYIEDIIRNILEEVKTLNEEVKH